MAASSVAKGNEFETLVLKELRRIKIECHRVRWDIHLFHKWLFSCYVSEVMLSLGWYDSKELEVHRGHCDGLLVK